MRPTSVVAHPAVCGARAAASQYPPAYRTRHGAVRSDRARHGGAAHEPGRTHLLGRVAPPPDSGDIRGGASRRGAHWQVDGGELVSVGLEIEAGELPSRFESTFASTKLAGADAAGAAAAEFFLARFFGGVVYVEISMQP